MSQSSKSGRLDYQRDGFLVFWDETGLRIQVTDYHAGPLSLPWEVVLDLARQAGHGAPSQSAPAQGSLFALPAIPTASEYRRALEKIADAITDNHRRMLRAQFHAPDRTMTAGELARAIGYAYYGAANSQYGRLGHLLSDALGLLPERRPNGTYRWYSLLSSWKRIGSQDGQFIMHPALAEALEALGWV